MKANYRVEKADVLIVGSGAAGLRAAIEAAERGKDTLLVSKTPLGRATSTAVSGGAFTLAIEGLDIERHYERTVEGGRGLNNRGLLRIMVEEAPEKVLELERFGLEMTKGRGFVLCKGRPQAYGLTLSEALNRGARKAGVRFHERVMALDFILDGGEARGLSAYDFIGDNYIIYLADAVIIASGGAGDLYSRHDNPVHTTGDGYAMSLRAGLCLQDVEFVQFYPLGTAEIGKAKILLPPTLADHGSILNSLGEDVLKKHNVTERPVAIRARDKTSRAMFSEIMGGNDVDGALLLDLTHLSGAEWPKEQLAGEAKEILQRRFHCDRSPLKVSPMCHHFMGGLKIDESCCTGLPGLFAAGEVTGGIHGANRMGGNALSEAIVFGVRAGRAAAEHGGTSLKESPSLADAARCFEKLQEIRSRVPDMENNPGSIKAMLQEVMWKNVGIIRCKEGLEEALSIFESFEKERLSYMGANNPSALREAMEVVNALSVCKAVAMSAMAREESRGAHYRKDYPSSSEMWLGNIAIKQEDRDLTLSFSSSA